jgi:hypothetical protein
LNTNEPPEVYQLKVFTTAYFRRLLDPEIKDHYRQCTQAAASRAVWRFLHFHPAFENVQTTSAQWLYSDIKQSCINILIALGHRAFTGPFNLAPLSRIASSHVNQVLNINIPAAAVH